MRRLGLVVLLFALVAGSMSFAAADDFGCTVMLCMSNPGGPSGISECDPAMNQLKAMMKKRNFTWPKCEPAEATGSYSRPVRLSYLPCPNDYAEVPTGVIALKQSDYQKAMANPQWLSYEGRQYLKWDYQMYSGSGGSANPIGQQSLMSCSKGGVQTHLNIAKTRKEGTDYYTGGGVYDDVLYLPPSGMVVEVYVNGELVNRLPINW